MASDTTITTANNSESSLGAEDSFFQFQADIPASALKADLYAADDIDGVTEGLLGSGNLNYMIAQTQQTNEAAFNTNPFSNKAIDDLFNDVPGLAGNQAGGAGGNAVPDGFSGFGSNDGDSLFDVTLGQRGDDALPTSGNDGAQGNFASTVSTTAFQETSSNQTGIDGLNGIDGFGNDGVDGNDGNDGNDGDDGTDGENPDPPPPPPPPPGGDDVDLTLDIDSDILNGDVDVTLDPIEAIVGDIDIDIDAVLGDVLSFDDGILPNPEVIIDALIGGVDIIPIAIGPVLDPVEELLGGVVDDVNELLDGVLGDLLPGDPLNLLGGLLGGTDGDRDLFIDLGAALPGLGLTGLDALADLSIDVPLDVVENILGDIDLGIDLTAITNGLLTGSALDIPDITAALITGGDILPDLTQTLLSTNDLTAPLAPILDPLLAATEPLSDAVNGITTGLIDALGGGVGEPLQDILGGALDNDLVAGVADIAAGLTDELNDGLGDGLLDPVGDLVLDLTGGLTDAVGDTPLDGALDDILGDGLDGALGNILAGDLMDGDGIGDVVDNLLGDGGLGLGDGLGSGLDDLLGGDIGGDDGLLGNIIGGIGGDNDGAEAGAADEDVSANIDLGLGDIGLDALGLDTVLDPVENIVGDVDLGLNVDLDAPELLGDLANGDLDGVVGAVGDALGGLIDDGFELDLLNPESDQNDGLELDLSDLGLGDLGGGGLLGGLTDTTDGLGDLLGNATAEPGDADTDLAIDTGLDLGGIDDLAVNAVLDPVENLIGDVDVGVDLSGIIDDVTSGNIAEIGDDLLGTLENAIDLELDLLNPEADQDGGLDLDIGGLADDLLGDGGLLGGDGGGLWPEASIGDGLLGDGGLLDGGLLGGGDLLPEPEGIVADGLGMLNDVLGGGSDQGGGGGLLGGLFG